jgi:predicted Zn-dependent peptidase
VEEDARGRAEVVSGELHVLSNGLRIAVDPLPGAESVALGLYAMVGSRSEPAHLSGLAHVVEHMVFKGAGPRDTRQIAEAIEDVGGVINAWTARDQTVFYGRTLAKDAPLLAELIADFLRAPHLADEHLEREKAVILSELGEAVDAPDDLVHDHLFEAAFEGQPLGRSVLGRAETLASIRAEDCRAWLRDELVPSRLILSASGKVEPAEIVKLAERLFGDMENWPGVPIGRAEFTGGVRNDRREFEQAHWCLGLPGVPASDPRLPALSIFVQALGGGMSSRLFQELREERGLAYSVSAWSQAYADTGIVTLSCAADRNRAVESMHLAREVLSAAVAGLTEAEVQRARAQMEAGLLMSMETPQGRADHMARSIEVFGRIMPVEGLLAQIRDVDSAAARAAGAAMLDGRAAVASVGAQLALAA